MVRIHRDRRLATGLAVLLGAGFLAAAAPAIDYDPAILKPHLVDVGGGRRMNLVCVGQGSPTLLFEQGGEGSILNWHKVQKALTRLTRTCFYDRAGFGWSDPPRKPVTAMNVTDDTHELIRLAGVRTPVVIVGHSIGGFYATVYADRFPTEVAGLVLVEPGFANQSGFLTPATRSFGLGELRKAEKHLPACAERARRGQLHLGKADDCLTVPVPKTPAERSYLSRNVEHPAWYEAEYDQSRNYFMADQGDSLDTIQERRVRRSFGAMPVIVLSVEKPLGDPWMDANIYRAFADHWREGHDQLAARSSRVVPGASHFAQLSRPEAVIDAVTKVVRDVRRRGR